MDTTAVNLDMVVQSHLISAQKFMNVSTSTNDHDIAFNIQSDAINY